LVEKRKALIPLLLFFTLALSGAGAESIDLYLYLQDVVRAAPPRIFGDYLIFSCTTRVPARIVGARFSHENFRHFHTFRKNENNVYILALPVPDRSQTVKYRIMIDGVWGPDQANPLRKIDERGIAFSLVPYERIADPAGRESPRLLTDGFVEFNLKAESGSVVTVAGDFNAYDPFTLRMREKEPGLFSLRLKLLPGLHYYFFTVDGVRLIDPQNDRPAHDADRKQYSLLVVP
jgi:hypothetical protein